jgi:hypothetical protein
MYETYSILHGGDYATERRNVIRCPLLTVNFFAHTAAFILAQSRARMGVTIKMVPSTLM